MRINRMDHEALLVNGDPGGEHLSKHERQTLKHQASDLNEMMEKAKQQPIKE